MSALGHLTTARLRLPRARAPRLRLAPRPAPTVAGNGAFLAIVGGLILAGMAALLVLNTSLAQGAFELQRLQAQQSDLQVTEQSLQQQVEAAQSPVALKARADELGMVPVTVPAFLRLADGAVLGDPTPATRPAAQSTARHRGRAQSDAAVLTGTGTDAAAPDPTTEHAVPPPARAGGHAGAVTGPEAAEEQAAPGAPAVHGPEGAEDAAPPARGVGGNGNGNGGNGNGGNGNGGNGGNGNGGNG